MVITAVPSHRRRLTHPEIKVQRFSKNPLIVPDPNRFWMSAGAFNCGVVRDDGLYRMLLRGAFREDHQYSDIGLALSENGEDWFINDEPVIRSGFNKHCIRGIEDPRIIEWTDGYYYIFASVCSLSGVYRVGMWKTRNFLGYEWMGILFDEREELKHQMRNKNAAVFPELIGNRVYLIHRWLPFSDMWLSVSRDGISSDKWHGEQILLRADQLYPSLKDGVEPNSVAIAAPPIRTPKGWLVIVNVTHKESNVGRNYYGLVYSISFVVLDLNDPQKINYVHSSPIVWPEAEYEVTGGSTYVCYCCAAVDTGGDDIFVFWGAADTVLAGGRLRKEDLRGICY